jgi:hypothetical protein
MPLADFYNSIGTSLPLSRQQMTAAYGPEAEASKGIGWLARGGARENNGGTVRSRSAPG